MSDKKSGLFAPQFREIDGLQIRFATKDREGGNPILLFSPLPESILAFLPTWDMFSVLGPLLAVDLPRKRPTNTPVPQAESVA
jgi:hypothetical protein